MGHTSQDGHRRDSCPDESLKIATKRLDYSGVGSRDLRHIRNGAGSAGCFVIGCNCLSIAVQDPSRYGKSRGRAGLKNPSHPAGGKGRSMDKLRRSAAGLKAYRESGDDMKTLGYRAIREVHDHDNNSTLTFWCGLDNTVITQCFWETGDICHFESCAAPVPEPVHA